MHRMGSETRQCPCDCGGPLQPARLQAHGAFTVLMMRRGELEASSAKGEPSLPSCAEVAALLGFDSAHPWDSLPQRLGLAALGNSVAPPMAVLGLMKLRG
eukprot:3800965-Prorocentrum_lima.AAC.1